MLFLGFSAGLPLLLVLGTLSFWLREAGIDRATIGFLSWIGLAFGFKWAWAPLVDRMPLPFLTRWLGRRRSWLLFAQCGIAAMLVGVALSDPQASLTQLVLFALATAFLSATQDIALDAYRIEAVGENLQGAMAASYQAGYRIAMIAASAGALWIAAGIAGGEGYHYAAWRGTYLVMAGFMSVGMIATLLLPEPQVNGLSQGQTDERAMAVHLANVAWLPPRAARTLAWIYGAAISPLLDFVRRYRWQAVLILALIATYRISDVVMGVMSNPFYVDMGYTKQEVATVSKVYGVIMTIVGAGLGGVLTARFAWLAMRGHDLTGLIFVISADNLAGGIASSAFVAYLSGLTNVAYSATQYALFSSLMLLLPKFIAGFSGVAVNAYGYAAFFNATALLGAPVLILVWLAARVHDKPK
jgi:PAT family beta-lactamase induction signal transducer AmpG